MSRDVVLENQIIPRRSKKRGYSKRHERRGGPYVSPWASLLTETQKSKNFRGDARNVRRGRERNSFASNEAER